MASTFLYIPGNPIDFIFGDRDDELDSDGPRERTANQLVIAIISILVVIIYELGYVFSEYWRERRRWLETGEGSFNGSIRLCFYHAIMLLTTGIFGYFPISGYVLRNQRYEEFFRYCLSLTSVIVTIIEQHGTDWEVLIEGQTRKLANLWFIFCLLFVHYVCLYMLELHLDNYDDQSVGHKLEIETQNSGASKPRTSWQLSPSNRSTWNEFMERTKRPQTMKKLSLRIAEVVDKSSLYNIGDGDSLNLTSLVPHPPTHRRTVAQRRSKFRGPNLMEGYIARRSPQLQHKGKAKSLSITAHV